MLAATFTAGWAAVVATFGTLTGTLLTHRLAQRGEAQRGERAAAEREADRIHEQALREAELRDAHRARLFADRRSAYSDLYRQYWHYWRLSDVAQGEAQILEVHLGAQRQNGSADESKRTELNEQVEAQRAVWQKALRESRRVLAEFEHTLPLVELVASRDVVEAIAGLRLVLFRVKTWEVRKVLAPAEDNLPREEYLKAHGELLTAEARLRAAIQSELELNR